jgi:transposase
MGQKKHKYPVKLTSEERSQLNRQTMQGRIQVRQLKRAQILLLADENHASGRQTDKAIAAQLAISMPTVERIRRRYVEHGLEVALKEQPRSGRPARISGQARAKITALACSTPPEGYGRWSLRLLADKAVELEFIEQISHDAVGTILKKTNSNRT